MTKHTGADLVIQALLRNGVDTVFGYPGGAIMPLYDALYDAPITHILTRHEQMAVHAAEGYARVSGKVGVCIATSGPGATNLVTGLADAWMDSTPIVAITGQVATHLIGTDAFQEANVVGVSTAVTKQTFQPRTTEELIECLDEAFYIARSGRPGPVIVDIPKDVLIKATERGLSHAETPVIPGYKPHPSPNWHDVSRALDIIRNAKKPLIIIGGGCKMSGMKTVELFRKFCAQTGIPVTSTLHGLGSTGPDYPFHLGLLGMHGLKRANKAVGKCDVLVALGMRFDDRVTGAPDKFAKQARILHVDIDPAEINKLIPVELGIAGDLGEVLETWLDEFETAPFTVSQEWQAEAFAPGDGLKLPELLNRSVIPPTDLLDAFFEVVPSTAVVTTDVGQHQMWAAQRARPADPHWFITSGGLGTMGFGLPSAIGAQFACPDKLVVAVVGDGGFQMSIAELATLKRHQLPIKILVMDNKYLGMVRQWQELFYQGRYSAVDLRDNPDFAAIAAAYGIHSATLNQREHIHETLVNWLTHPGPALLHCECHIAENVFPMIPAGAAIDEMMEAAPAVKA
ncbi:MAG: biosynthetic-type acetolactate synthase large subunit [Blastocatellia bacterium]|nr:biosynthetic-type acetolactate synthase large subunit [Blastocatellia bacterium]